MLPKIEITREDIDPKAMVYCPPIMRYVPIAFCFRGGPMDSKGTCLYFQGIDDSEKGPGQSFLGIKHAIPSIQPIEIHVSMSGE